MDILWIILGVLGLLIVLVLVLAAMKPNAFRVERSATMQAGSEKVFPLINDFHNWPEWSPWEKMEPTMTKTHSGAAAGKGAVYEWVGKKVGTGRMEILDSTPASRVLIKLDFFRPFEAHNTAEFGLAANGGATTVTWAMYGAQPFMLKVMSIFMSMDKMVGKDFEAGLASMKAKAEQA